MKRRTKIIMALILAAVTIGSAYEVYAVTTTFPTVQIVHVKARNIVPHGPSVANITSFAGDATQFVLSVTSARKGNTTINFAFDTNSTNGWGSTAAGNVGLEPYNMCDFKGFCFANGGTHNGCGATGSGLISCDIATAVPGANNYNMTFSTLTTDLSENFTITWYLLYT